MIVLRRQILFSCDVNVNVSLSQDKRLLCLPKCILSSQRRVSEEDRTQFTSTKYDHDIFILIKIFIDDRDR